MNDYPNFHPEGKLREEFPCHMVEAVYADRLDECGVSVVYTGMTMDAQERWPEGFLYPADGEQLAASIRAALWQVESYRAREIEKILRDEREPDGPNPYERE